MASMKASTDKDQRAGRGRRDRAVYKDAGKAQREAMRRLNAVPTSAKQMDYWRITATAITQVGSYSQVSDEVRRSALADQCDVSPRTVTRALEWAARHGVLTWASGRAGGAWRLTLPSDPWTEDAGNCPGVESASLDSSGPHLSRGGGQNTAGTGHTSEVSEKKTEKNPPSPPTADEPDAAVTDGWGIGPLTIERAVAGLPVQPDQQAGLTDHARRLVAAGVPLEAVSAVMTPRLKTARSPVSVIRSRLTAIEGMNGPQVWSWMRAQRLTGRPAAPPAWAWEQGQQDARSMGDAG